MVSKQSKEICAELFEEKIAEVKWKIKNVNNGFAKEIFNKALSQIEEAYKEIMVLIKKNEQ